MLFTFLAAMALLVLLPLTICVLDNIFRLLFDSVLSTIPNEFVVTMVVSLGICGFYAASGTVASRLGREINGLFEQILLTL